MSPSSSSFNLFSFTHKFRILHLTWFAFFLTFVVWFNHAPLLLTIKEVLGLTDDQIKILLILNVALTIPARVIIGMLVDNFGPRIVFSLLLFVSSFLCFFFATAQDFETLAIARFLLGFVGAGFVIGIRMISEWFPAKQLGVAEGIYKGMGNFGSAVAAMTLPALALFFGGDDGWRYAVGTTGFIILVYSFVYYSFVTDTPEGSTYFKPNKTGGLEVTSKSDFFFYLITNLPLYAAMGILSWKLSLLGLLDSDVVNIIYTALVVVYLFQSFQIFKVNAGILKEAVPDIHRYKFKQVAILSLAYAVTFGTELAVVSMLPLFFIDTFEVSIIIAGLLASCYAFVDIISCPSGGLISDKLGRKKSLLVLLVGIVIGFLVLGQIDSSWPIALVVAAIMICSFFVGSGSGAVFAVVPLIKRRLTGQIAGIVGAYGNVGAVIFLTVYSFVTPQTFFLVISGSTFVVFLISFFMDEPEGTMVEVLPDGTVQMIEVS
ncbi:MAG TPA: NarK family nitrate/nitrite MFS transporter [Thiotrichaceae bacterium]|nr:NarK family nitrate/nitrite MFS transporter [Thiotrichaceae bacterium]HIM07081.1 NarK family nitrate/nitrite MFS transporter [Gammaproteobacteria bacterium]